MKDDDAGLDVLMMVFMLIMVLMLMMVLVLIMVMRMFESTKTGWRKNSRNVAFKMSWKEIQNVLNEIWPMNCSWGPILSHNCCLF